MVSKKGGEPHRFDDWASAKDHLDNHPEFTDFIVVDESSHGDATPQT